MILLSVATGCAATRSVVDLKPGEEINNPTDGQIVKLLSVEDKRVFEEKPRIPEIPSLDPEKINDPSIKARAIARKRNSYGAAMGDVLLPEGKTVALLMEKEVVNAFKEAGYRIAEPNDPDYGIATPVQVDINKFWSWFIVGLARVGNQAEIRLEGELGKGTQAHVISNNYESEPHFVVTESVWIEDTSTALSTFRKKIVEYLKP